MTEKMDDVTEKEGMDVGLAVCKLHISDDESADMTQVFWCARLIGEEKVRMDSENCVVKYW